MRLRAPQPRIASTSYCDTTGIFVSTFSRWTVSMRPESDALLRTRHMTEVSVHSTTSK